MCTKMSRYFFLIAVLTIITGIVAHAAAEPRRGGEVVISVGTGTPRAFNSAVATGYTTGMVSTQLFASPLRYDENWNPKPYLAKSWKISEDGLSVTLNLVKGATFHDGRPITSEDVAFSVMTAKKYHPFQSAFIEVERVDTPDPYTAVIGLKHPMPAILLAMSPSVMPIFPKHVYGNPQDLKADPAQLKPVGSGPFKFVKYEPGKYVLMERNEHFFIPGRPFLARLVFRIERDPDVQMIEMERQEAHLMPFFTSPRGLARLSKDQHLGITDQGYQAIGAINWLAFNLLKKPLNDKRVRQAIGYAVDREFITGFLHEGKSKVATGPITPDNPFYEVNVPSYNIDLTKADRLLDEAGYPRKTDGRRFGVTLDYAPALPSHQRDVALYIKRQLEKIGIHVTVRRPANFLEWVNHVANWDFDMAMDMVSNYPDPILGVQRTYLSNNIRKGVMWSNTQNYRNKEVDELLAQAAMELDSNKRRVLYSKFQKVVTEELPIFWINVVSFHTVYNKGLENLPLSIWGVLSPLDELYWKKPPVFAYVSTPTLEAQSSPLKQMGVRAITLIKERGLYPALEDFTDPNQGFLDLNGSGLHIIGFTKKGIVFLDNSGQMKAGMDISEIFDLEGSELLPQFLDAAKGKEGGFLKSAGVWPHPKTHEVGPMSAWCGMLTDEDAICILEWENK